MARFNIRVARPWQLVMRPFGVTRDRAFVDVTNDEVRFHYGLLFDHTVTRADIETASRREWPWWMGIGLRTNFRGLIGLIGSYEGVVEIKLRTRIRTWVVFRCDRLAVSLDDPDVFIAAISSRAAAPVEERKPAERKMIAGAAPEPAKAAARGSRSATPRRSARPKKAPAVKKTVAKRGTTRRRRTGDS